MEERRLIKPAKGQDPLAIVWSLRKKVKSRAKAVIITPP
jgi:hypothetical protein